MAACDPVGNSGNGGMQGHDMRCQQAQGSLQQLMHHAASAFPELV